MLLRSYAVPKTSPSFSCARKASARPLAGPPASNASGGISTVVTKLVASR